jgi:hypothetical protein
VCRRYPRPILGDLRILAEQGLDKGLRIELGDGVGFLAQADELDVDVELVLDGDHDASPGRAVQFGQGCLTGAKGNGTRLQADLPAGPAPGPLYTTAMENARNTGLPEIRLG